MLGSYMEPECPKETYRQLTRAAEEVVNHELVVRLARKKCVTSETVTSETHAAKTNVRHDTSLTIIL